MRKIRGDNAFTLVEILVVVILLGILAAVVVPRFTDAGDEARTAATNTNVNTVQGQVEVYRSRYGSYPANLEALVTAGYIPEVPTGLSYNAATGRVTAAS
jgi:general secretion pathway protein G